MFAIKQLRISKKMTANELAESAGLGRPYISLIENGHATPSIDVLSKIAQALQVEIADLFSQPNDVVSVAFQSGGFASIAKAWIDLPERLRPYAVNYCRMLRDMYHSEIKGAQNAEETE
ncbi:MAG: helix-turn-helix transcriptional regulator [Synergistaceae bacterium]|jgi:transcriptional regulator with XRE-family HTH domain|nr:helix-turn-helix transcriptional regulator [Synergistaceae bacterium]